jgi:hypothetical protein
MVTIATEVNKLMKFTEIENGSVLIYLPFFYFIIFSATLLFGLFLINWFLKLKTTRICITIADIKFGTVRNIFLSLRQDVLGPNFAPFINPPDDEDKKKKVKSILIEEIKEVDGKPVTVYIGILCLVKVNKTGKKKWIGVFRDDKNLRGDSEEICRQIVKEFNDQYKQNKAKKCEIRSYLTKENILFVLHLYQSAVLMYIQYTINKRRPNA